MTAPRRGAAAIGCGAAVAVGVGLAAIAARRAHPAEVSPVVPSGHWDAVWVWGLVAALAFYGIGTVFSARVRPPVVAVAAIAIIVQALPLISPVVLSKDVYAYWAEARVLVTHHESPYTSTPADHAGDPALPFVSEQWRDAPAAYGPAWEALAAAPAVAAGDSPQRAALGYRLLALAGILACVVLLARSSRSPWSVALLGWNPLVAIHFGGGGHNDAWMAALLVLAVCARGSARAGAAWPLAAAFKVAPAILLPVELARTRLRQPRGFWVGFGVATAIIVALSTSRFGTQWATAPVSALHQSSPLGAVNWLMDAGLAHRYAVAVAGLAFAGVYVVLLVLAWRTRRARLSLATTALVLCSAARPWYALWPIGLAAAEEDGVAAVAAYVLTAYFLLNDAVAF
jgi:hypothetical protein